MLAMVATALRLVGITKRFGGLVANDAISLDLARGEIIAMHTAGNTQAIYGEDVVSRMTHIKQAPTALAAMRKLCTEHGAVLILD